MRYIDMHAHIWGSSPLLMEQVGLNPQDISYDRDEPECNIQRMLPLFDENPDLARIGLMPLYGGHYPAKNDIVQGNDDTVMYCVKYPDEFFGYFTVNPYFTKNAVQEIRRASETEQIYGIKAWVACRCDREEFVPTIKACIEYDLPIVIHAFNKKPGNLQEEARPEHVAIVAKRFPEAKIVMAHVGMDWPCAIREIADCENVWTDFSGSCCENGMLEKAVRYLGAERVLFGSDLPECPLITNIGLLEGADISEEEKNQIGFENTNKLFGLHIKNNMRIML
jgi:uncharacterized protein